MMKALIVDDDPLIICGLMRALHSLCDVVHYAAYGKVALSKISSTVYDVCFLDVNLPDAHGIDLMESIIRLSPETKIVIMTADLVDPDMREKITGKAFHFLAKPFELGQIQSVVNKARGVEAS